MNLSEIPVFTITLYILAISICLVLSIVIIALASDAYEKYRFNSRRCRKCGCELKEYNDKYAPYCRAFRCTKCNYFAYVSYNNRLLDTYSL